MHITPGVKLRILLAIESAGAGSGRHVIDLIGGLLQRGHDVSLVYSTLRAEPWFEEAAQELPELTVHQIQMQRKPGLHDLSALRRIRTVISHFGPYDILHGHSAKSGALIRLAGAGTGAVRVYTPHALITMNPSLGLWRRWGYSGTERFLSPFANGIICVSKEERRHACDLGIRPDKLFVVENGLSPQLSPDRAVIRKQLGLDDKAICLGFVGRICEQKSVERLIKSFMLLYKQFENLHLLIVGDGPGIDETKVLAESLGIADRLIFTGQADGPALMAAFDIFAMTSSYEAFPYVYLEALAAGLPIVTTKVGGASAVVRHGINGFIVPQDRLDRVVAHVAELCNHPELRHEMGSHSLEMAREFSVGRMVEQTIDIYEHLLGRSTQPTGVLQ